MNEPLSISKNGNACSESNWILYNLNINIIASWRVNVLLGLNV